MKKISQILGLMLFAFAVFGVSPMANAHSTSDQGFGTDAMIAIAQTKVRATEKMSKMKVAYHSLSNSNSDHQNKNCMKNCAQTCPPSTCMTGILAREVLVLRVSGFAGRLPFHSMRSDYVARAHSLFHPPKV